MKNRLNINCDLGEGAANDELIMPFIQSCNIACSGHVGDENSIARAIELAAAFDVKIGAHPSFPDKNNFGRKIMQMERSELIQSLCEQIDLFQKIARSQGVEMHHIKLHGALYNQAASNPKMAEIVLEALQQMDGIFNIYAPYRSQLANLAKNQYTIVYEAFIDRTYQDDLSLTSRTQANALITDPTAAWLQLESIWLKKQVICTNGKAMHLEADTFCVHGDSDHALPILTYIHKQVGHV